jgi:hypothetical protein
VGATTVRRVWHSFGLKPHLSRSFKVSQDLRFEDKLLDVVGLYLNPPEHALVLSCDEKSQIQALNRTQPGLPMKKGRAGTVTHVSRRRLSRPWPARVSTRKNSKRARRSWSSRRAWFPLCSRARRNWALSQSEPAAAEPAAGLMTPIAG